MRQDDQFRVETFVWCSEDAVWYPALVQAVRPDGLVVKWAETHRDRWSDSFVERARCKLWDQWETIIITKAIQDSHYTFWNNNHAGFKDVLPIGGQRQVRRRSVDQMITATAATPILTAERPTTVESKNIRKRGRSRITDASPSKNVSDPPAQLSSVPSLSANYCVCA